MAGPISIPKMPSPASHYKTKLTFMDHQKKEPPNYMVPKVAPIKVLRRGRTWLGGGWASVPPPYASPLVYMLRGKDPPQGLRFAHR